MSHAIEDYHKYSVVHTRGAFILNVPCSVVCLCILPQQTGQQKTMADNSLRTDEEIDEEELGKLTVLKFVRLELSPRVRYSVA